MNTLTLNSDFKLTLPKEIRNKFHFQKGQKFIAIPHQNRIELIIEQDIKQYRGFLKGMDTAIERDTDRI